MSKYDRLGDFLRSQGKDLVPMTFAEVERVVGTRLPASKEYPAWWSNNPWNNVMTQVWLDAGYRTEQVDVPGQRLVFRKVVERPQGMKEEARMFQTTGNPIEKVSIHPASGALKGLMTIEPGYDITKPALDPDELDAWEAKLDRIADEAGMRDRK